jgi:hypothetical protein
MTVLHCILVLNRHVCGIYMPHEINAMGSYQLRLDLQVVSSLHIFRPEFIVHDITLDKLFTRLTQVEV